jgi:uncharacterized SAM-binding protein YcdF (DUF218 family)
VIFLYVGKVLTALATPLTLAVVALLLASFALRKTRPRILFGVVVFATVVLLFGSSGWCSGLLLKTLEQPYANATIASTPTADAIVVLGGYIRFEAATGRPIEISSAADRLFCAFELYRASKAPLILLSGGNVFNVSATPQEAVLARSVLEEWGIPSTAILIEDQSRNTHENSTFSEPILAGKGIRHILLVTSAFHMRRAAATFRRTGLTVYPFAADFMTEAGTPNFLLSLFPDPQAIADSGIAIKEWLGLAVYRWRGWAD